MPFTAIILARYNDADRGPVIIVDARHTRQLPMIPGMRSDDEVHDKICGMVRPIMTFDLLQCESHHRVFVYNCQTRTCPHSDPYYLCQTYGKGMHVNTFVRLINMDRPISSYDGQRHFEDLAKISMHAFTHAAMEFALDLGEISEHDMKVFVNTSRITPQHAQLFVNFLNTNDPSGQPPPPYPCIEDFLPPVEHENDLIFALDNIKLDIPDECTICCDSDHPPTRTLHRCKHAFHAHCILQWGVFSTTCPNCRAKIDSRDLR